MLVSTAHTYLMHCPQCMQVNYMHEIGKEKISPPLSAWTSGGARSGRLRTPQTLLDAGEASGLLLNLLPQSNLTLKVFLHASPNGRHKGS